MSFHFTVQATCKVYAKIGRQQRHSVASNESANGAPHLPSSAFSGSPGPAPDNTHQSALTLLAAAALHTKPAPAFYTEPAHQGADNTLPVFRMLEAGAAQHPARRILCSTDPTFSARRFASASALAFASLRALAWSSAALRSSASLCPLAFAAARACTKQHHEACRQCTAKQGQKPV